MLFVVEIAVEFPAGLSDPANPRHRALLGAELERGVELRAAGVIKRIWRIPGSMRNIGIWETEDATALDEAIRSLPLWPWLRVTTTPLADHPVEIAYRELEQRP